jgi:hypothetical protein
MQMPRELIENIRKVTRIFSLESDPLRVPLGLVREQSYLLGFARPFNILERIGPLLIN